MDYRIENKLLEPTSKKISELALFRERAIRRVNWDYTQHLIWSGNQQQKRLDKEQMRGEEFVCRPLDLTATSTVGFVSHLDASLAEMCATTDASKNNNQLR